ncbi:MAG: hypothetical protein KF814_01080 [Nitrospiraceae bacterium]|nr:hypothetical protein [Nitrospiraceae bacterium]
MTEWLARLKSFFSKAWPAFFGPVKRPVRREDVDLYCVSRATSTGDVIRFRLAKPRGSEPPC